MKKIHKILLALLILGLLAAGGLWWFNRSWKQQSRTNHIDALAAIPRSAVYILETDRPQETWKQVHRNPVFRRIKQLPDFAFLQAVDSLLTHYVTENDLTAGFFRHRKFLLSAHITAGNDYDFLYVLDMERELPAATLMSMLRQWGPDAMHIRRLSVGGHPAWKITGLTDDPLYLSLYHNLALVSFSYQIIRQSLLETAGAPWLRRSDMMRLREQTSDGLVRIYFNYKRLVPFLQTFGLAPGAMTSALTHNLSLSGWAVDSDDELIQGHGWTFPDSSAVFVAPFRKAGRARSRAYRILPRETMLYTALLTDDFARFYRETTGEYFKAHPDARKAYDRYTAQLNKWFGWDPERDFVAWIGDEVGVAKLASGHQSQTALLLIRADDIDFAREKLDLLSRKLRRRSPVKFKSYDFEGYTIHYLYQKSLFRHLFGSWLGGFRTPYYTIAGDYVVFANSAADLERLIRANLSGQTLAREKAFRPVEGFSGRRSNLLVWAHIPSLFVWSYKQASPSERKALKVYYPLARALGYTAFGWGTDGDRIRSDFVFQTRRKP